MNKEMIVKRVVRSGLNTYDPIVDAKDYHNQALFENSRQPILGVVSPLSRPMEIFPDGHGWKKYAGKPEMQFNRKFDTFSCVIYSIAKSLVYYLKVKYNIEVTISEMYNAYWAGVVSGRGTSIRQGMESFRQYGWIEDADYPFTAETTELQFRTRPPEYIVTKAKGQLRIWNFHWEVIPTDHNSIIDALRRTPVVLTGFAWASYYGEGVYYDYNNPANHAFLGIDYKENRNIIVDDSYPKDYEFDQDSNKDEFFKELDQTYKFGSAHICWLTSVSKESLISKLKNMFEKLVRDIHGGLWFVKDGKKQKLDGWLALAGALMDEIGCKTLTDEQLNKLTNFQFFGK